MAYNRFYLNTLVRIIAFALTNLGFFYFLLSGERFFTTLFLGILLFIQVIWLFYYINIVNLNLSRFLLMLSEEETTIIPLKTRVEKTFGGLQHSFNRLNEEMARARLEREYAGVLVQHVVDHLGTGVMAWDSDGKVELINDSGLKLFDRSEITQLGELDETSPKIAEWLRNLEIQKKGTWHLDKHGEKVPITFRAAGFRLGEKQLTLASFQSIHTEMAETEMQSWEKLIRVLTHEVSNSVTPITTLGSNIRKRLHTAGTTKTGHIRLSGELAKDIIRSAELIEQRGNGLVDFIGQYKTFMRLPEPDIRKINLKELIDDAGRLGENLESSSSYKIRCSVEPPGIHCLVDHKMIEQVLLNLVRNALEAIPEDREGSLEISGRIPEAGFASIQVKDNGTGIPSEILDQVFIPFFTTKEKGSGIGLSFCRRIISMNGGNIRIESTSETGTIVSITLPTATS